VITAPELAGRQPGSIYKAIRHIRPELFRTRDNGAIPVDQVVPQEYISARKAANRYGMTFRDEILLVQTRGSSGDQLSIRLTSPRSGTGIGLWGSSRRTSKKETVASDSASFNARLFLWFTRTGEVLVNLPRHHWIRGSSRCGYSILSMWR
jgi:hypothetical protein